MNWFDENTEIKPTEQEVNDELVRLKELAAQREYRLRRKDNYLSVEEQLDMLYWDRTNGTNTWQDHIDEVKANNPKPVE